ncbi:MAG: N-acetyl-gamma-glutamyl-phosphate reductase [Spirochaetaceae bacterium]|nr:N-acetyl-gamma-glutamyl-phosphate reductase [Spirochaetaceae bacterium]|tara:strand:- start:22148 stop:23191 length:1044 start_codon:yes stop_codon:yes gene_type:complete
MIPVSIFGAGGLTGRELLTWLRHHPQARPVFVTSDQHAGKSVSEIFPELPEYQELRFSKHTDPCPADSLCFLATPNKTSMDMVPALLEKGHRVIDLSGSFRIPEKSLFEQYYGLEHTCHDLMKEVVYGMPELFRDQIKGARAVANPGCYPTGSILPLFLMGEHRNQIRSVIIDAKSGVSGAGGRTEDSGFAFQNVYENFRAYKILKHQHTPEIQIYAMQGINRFRSPDEGSDAPPLVFTPHLLPLYRGILSSIVIEWQDAPPRNLSQQLQASADNEPFLRFYETPEEVELRKVQNTNFVDFSVRSLGNISIVVSAIDNLVKGAAGQAIQNMNLMYNLAETSGLLASR